MVIVLTLRVGILSFSSDTKIVRVAVPVTGGDPGGQKHAHVYIGVMNTLVISRIDPRRKSPAHTIIDGKYRDIIDAVPHVRRLPI